MARAWPRLRPGEQPSQQYAICAMHAMLGPLEARLGLLDALSYLPVGICHPFNSA